jgi:ribosomal protein L32
MKKGETHVKICPRCGNKKIVYRPGIDIGMMHAICMNCGYEANQHLFPNVSKIQAKKIKVVKGKDLDRIRFQNVKFSRKKRILLLGAVLIFLIVLFFMVY